MDLPTINRQSSVFIDLLTVFRKNTSFLKQRRSIYHAPSILKPTIETARYEDIINDEKPKKLK